VAGQGTSAVNVYPATPTAAANETTTPLLTSGAYTLAVTHTTAAGEQILALTMDNAPTLTHSFAFGYGVINWVTQGVFLGSRKVYLNNETDDFLLGNWLYAPSLHPACEAPNTCPTYYETGPDLQALAAWQANLQTDPLFQSYRQTFAVNGVGTTWFDPSDSVFAAMQSLNSQFWWLSHTWDHPNLDCYTTDNSGACVPATLAQSLSELNQDISVVPALGITFDEAGMVTPFNSGLTNASFLQAAAQVGIQYIVDPELPASPNTIITNTLVPSVLFVTRLNNDLFYDVSSPSSGVYGSWPDEYNANYGPDGTTPTYSEDQTYSQILDNLSQQLLQINMLSYSPYVIESHIANISTYDGTNSVFTDLMNATITKYESLFTLPVLSLDLEDIGALLQARTNYNNSGVAGVYTPGVSVVLTTTNAATIPVTGFCSQASCGTYGGQIQDNVVMTAGSSVTIPLPASVGVSLSSVAVSPASVTGGTSATGTVTLSGAAPTGGVSVALESNSTSATVPPALTIAAGSTNATFNVSTSTVGSSVSATVTASYSGLSQTAPLTITPPAIAISSVAVNPASVTGGTSATGTVTLTGAAPTGGTSVALSSNSASATVPATVTITAGSTTATFNVTTGTVASSVSATLTVSYGGLSKTAAVTVTPPPVAISSVAVNPASVTGGTSATGTVTLTGAAPTGGVSVALSSNSASATIPATVTVAAGSTTATFSVSTSTVESSVLATVTASYSGLSKTAAVTITPPPVAILSVVVNPASVTGGTSATGTVTLTGAAPTGGISLALSSNSASAMVPATVTVAAGSTTASFSVATSTVGSSVLATLTAGYSGLSKTSVLTVAVAPVSLSSIAVNPTSAAGGTPMIGTVSLSSAAPAGGVSVSLSSNNALAMAPASVLVPAGSTTAAFSVTTQPVVSTTSVTITATYGSVSQSSALLLTQLVSGPLRYVPVTPCRVLDTRNEAGAFGGPELAANATREFAIQESACGIPASAAAYALNITIVPDAALGYLSIWPAGQAQPLASTLNSDGRVKANAAIVPAGVNGGVSVYVTDSTQLIIDISGYFVAGDVASALEFFPLAPCRIADTRGAAGPSGGPSLVGGQNRAFAIAGNCGVPSTAAAYSLNFTAVPPGAVGVFTAWPTGQTKPPTSTLNASAASVTANAAIVAAGTGGSITTYTTDDTDLIIDINGYFAPAATGGLSLYPLTPCRVIDTRNPAGSPPFSGTTSVDVTGSGCETPNTAQAYVLNATVVPTGILGYLSLWPDGAPQPVVSTLNADLKTVTSNMAIVSTTNGSINAFAISPTYLILDVSGYFAP
jgi:hypothetical protein